MWGYIFLFFNLRLEYAQVFYKVRLKICLHCAYLSTCLLKFDWHNWGLGPFKTIFFLLFIKKLDIFKNNTLVDNYKLCSVAPNDAKVWSITLYSAQANFNKYFLSWSQVECQGRWRSLRSRNREWTWTQSSVRQHHHSSHQE